MRHPVRTAKRQLLRFGSCVLSALLALSSVPVSAVDNGVSPVYDEAYYAMTDYYGNLTEGSVVKSYLTNGYSTLTDYGQYDEVLNLTDGTVPSSAGGMTTFRFDAGTAPSHFYFEGKTTRPFEALPWTLAVSYKLNGVPTRAEELAGKTGVVEINLDAIPNPDAIEYARNNYTLEAMAIFNQDDILSLEAPGAQVQLIGNLRAVLFIGLPGEECHYTIRVGSEDFSFGGLTFMLVPATLSQLEEIAKLSERKDDLEDNYNKLSGSLDSLLDALYSMTGSLNASASGLDKLNEARGIFSGGKGVLYDGTDALREDLSNLSELLDPVEGQIETLSRTISDSKSVLNSMSNTSSDLRDELEDLEDALDRLESTGDLHDVLSKLSGSLVSLQNALGVTGSTVKKDTTEAIDNVQGVGSKTIEQLKAAHSAYASDRQTYYTLVLKKQGLEETQAASLSKVAAGAMAAGSVDAATTALKGQLTKLELAHAAAATEEEKAEIEANIIGIKAAIQYLPALEQAYQSKEAMSFQTFCQKVLGQSPADAKQTADLWLLYASGKLKTDAGTTTITGELLQNDPEEGSGSDSGSVSGSGSNSGSESEGGSPSGSESPSGGGSDAGSNTNAGNNSGNITGSGSSSSGSSDSGSGSTGSSDNNSQNNASGDSNDTTGDGSTPSAPAEGGENGTNGNEGETGNTGAGSVTTGDNNATTTEGGETGADGGKGETGGSTAATPGESESVGGAAIDLIAGGLDSATKQIKDLQSGLYTTMDNIAKPTGRVIDDLAALCARLSELTSLLNKAEGLTSALSGASGELRSILKDAEELQDLLDEYEPTLQETLKTVSSLSVSANKTIRDTQKLVTDTEALLKAAGTPLDAGTKQSLEALASVLRGAARTMSTAGEIKDAKTSICEIIEDTWDEYTGDVNNLLLMDATAEAVSLTDSRNPAPQSIQVLIRTQEITEPEEDEEEAAAAAAEKTTFWGRIAQMFKDLWAAVTGLFGGKD